MKDFICIVIEIIEIKKEMFLPLDAAASSSSVL